MRHAVFFDRDDTLLRRRGGHPTADLGRPEDAELVPGAAEACAALKNAGFMLVVVTNQGGVARGSHTPADVDRVNAHANMLLGGVIDAFRFCPYHPRGAVPEFTREHEWRKPAPGMILDAAHELAIDLPRSWMIGDAERDVEAGRRAGCRTILIAVSQGATAADFTAPTIGDAAALVLRRAGGAPEPGA